MWRMLPETLCTVLVKSTRMLTSHFPISYHSTFPILYHP
uniref:Uncharacterized protein n=1 Tax=Anguilla anguilla TaxID=7936 RepID=A0A0E9QPH5_ANGAN